MKYEPEFSLTRRKLYSDPKKMGYAVWVTMPNGDKLNITDLADAPTSEIKRAIQSAFNRGFGAYEVLMKMNVDHWCSPKDEWKSEEK